MLLTGDMLKLGHFAIAPCDLDAVTGGLSLAQLGSLVRPNGNPAPRHDYVRPLQFEWCETIESPPAIAPPAPQPPVGNVHVTPPYVETTEPPPIIETVVETPPPAPVYRTGLLQDVGFSIVNPDGTSTTPGDPMLLDLDGSGIGMQTNPFHDPVQFDLNGDGERETVGWVAREGASTDALLIRDDRFDGGAAGVQSGRELFGDQVGGNVNGFDRLADFDSNGDNVFDAQDAQWAEIELWQDFNHNGISEDGEISTLADHGIVAINVTPTDPIAFHNQNGETIQRGTFVRTA